MENTINDVVDQNQSQILTQPEAIAPPPPPPKSKLRKFIFVPIILILIGVLGYWYWLKLNYMENVPYGWDDMSVTEENNTNSENLTYTSSVNGMSFGYPKCLGTAATDNDPQVFGESVRFSQPDGCLRGLEFGPIDIGIAGIDRGGGGGVGETIVNRERFANSQDRDYVLLTYEADVDESDRFSVVGFYPKEKGGTEEDEWILTIANSNITEEQVLEVNNFYKSILETVKFESVAVEDFGGEYKKCPPKQPCSVVSLTQKTGSSFEVKGQAYYGTNTGLIEGIIDVNNGKAIFDDGDCVINMSFLNKYQIKLEERETGSCGGLNVTFNGTYDKAE